MTEEVKGAGEGANEQAGENTPADTAQAAAPQGDDRAATPGDQQQAGTNKWTAMEIVDGVAVPVNPLAPPAPPAPPAAGEQEGEPATPTAAPAGVQRLDHARNLVELAKGEAAELIAEGIQAFKDIEGRTMRVVHRLGQLFKQEV